MAKFCTDCGAQLQVDHKFCSGCGKTQQSNLRKPESGLDSSAIAPKCKCGTLFQEPISNVAGELTCKKCKGRIQSTEMRIGSSNILSKSPSVARKQSSSNTGRWIFNGIAILVIAVGGIAAQAWYQVINGNCTSVQIYLSDKFFSDGWVTCYQTEREALFYKLLGNMVISAGTFELILSLFVGLAIGVGYQQFFAKKTKE